MEPISQRLFIAVSLPEPVRAVLGTLAQPLPGVNWTRSEQLHLTLRFLGEVLSEKIELVLQRLTSVKVAPFVLPIEACGTFPPNAPPRVLWAEVGAGHPRLFQLRQRLDDTLLGCGLRFDVRSFHPHITLGRCAPESGPAVAAWLHAHREFAAPPFRVEGFDLYASQLQREGPVHTLLRRFPLAV